MLLHKLVKLGKVILLKELVNVLYRGGVSFPIVYYGPASGYQVQHYFPWWCWWCRLAFDVVIGWRRHWPFFMPSGGVQTLMQNLAFTCTYLFLCTHGGVAGSSKTVHTVVAWTDKQRHQPTVAPLHNHVPRVFQGFGLHLRGPQFWIKTFPRRTYYIKNWGQS